MKNITIVPCKISCDIFPVRMVLGRATANFAYYISQSELNGYTINAIGDDLLGKEILSNLKDRKLNYLMEKTEYPIATTGRFVFTPCHTSYRSKPKVHFRIRSELETRLRLIL